MQPLIPLLLSAVLSSVALAGTAPAADVPATPAAVRLPALRFSERTLPNGLRVLVHSRPQSQTVTTELWYRVGSRHERPGATGLAHFLEHLLFKGTRRLRKGEIDRLTYRNGGSNNAYTGNDFTTYVFNFPRRSWETALSVEADRMRNTRFDPREFEAERKVVMEERRQSEDDPEQRLSEELTAISLQNHPYRNPVVGWMDDLKRVTMMDVREFYLKHYVPANATLVIIGGVTPEEAFRAAERAFRGVPKLPRPTDRSVIEPPQLSSRRVELSAEAQSARLQWQFRLPPRNHPDTLATELATWVLARGKLSRLHRRLVTGDRSAGEVDGWLYTLHDFSLAGFNLSAAENGEPARIETAFWEEVRRLAVDGPTPSELQRARNAYLTQWIGRLERNEDIADVYGEADGLGGRTYLDTLSTRLRRVDSAAVRRVVGAYFAANRASTGLLVPRTRSGSPHTGLSRTPARVFCRTNRGEALRPGAVSGGFAPLHPLEQRLSNGVRVILLEERSLPRIQIHLRFASGSAHDPAELPGLSGLTARLLEEGAGARSHQEISESLEGAGAASGVAVGRTQTDLTLKLLSPSAPNLLPLFADLATSPRFSSDRLEIARDRQLASLRDAADDPGTVARDLFYDTVYQGHPFSRPPLGTETGLKAATIDDVAAQYRRCYRPDRATLVVVGDFSARQLLPELTRLFGGWQPIGESAAPLPPKPQRQNDNRLRTQTIDKSQTQIYLGHLGIRRSNPDFATLKVLDAILGEGVAGGFTARIPYQLRDVEGLAYRVGSSITRSADLTDGVFLATIGTEPANATRATAGLLREIRKIRSAPVTESELSEAIRYLSDTYLFQFETAEQIAAYLHEVARHGLGWDYRREFPRKLSRVTRQAVLSAAKQYLNPERVTRVVVGPDSAPTTGNKKP